MSTFSSDGLRVGIVGATGQVGTVMREILAERNFRFASCGSSPRRAPRAARCRGGTARSRSRTPRRPTPPAWTSRSSPWRHHLEAQAPQFAAAGVTVIDNSSAFRRDPDVPLIVSEVNPHALGEMRKGIIANPKHDHGRDAGARTAARGGQLTRIIASTYQAVSGSGGLAGVEELDGQVKAIVDKAAELTHDGSAVTFPDPVKYVRPIAFNVLPWPARSWTTAPSRPTRQAATRAARSSASPTCWSRARACAFRSSAATRCR